ncbi:caspase family protein [Sorangium sp. So ce134]
MTTNSKPAHVLLIGIDDYPRSPLHGCVNDVRAIERLLLERVGVDRKSITRLMSPHPGHDQGDTAPSRPATLAHIRDALAHLGTSAVAWNEPVFIYYSGHGTQTTVSSGEARYFREALVPVDFARGDGDAQLLFDFELNNLLERIGRRTQSVTVVLDCCSSAGITRSGLAPTGGRDRFLRVAEDAVVAREAFPRRDDARGVARALANGLAACQIVAACLADERAIECDDAGGVRHGALTSALLAKLEPLDPAGLLTVRWGAIWRDVLAGVARVNPQQHPWLYGDFGRRVFHGGDHAPMRFGIVRRDLRYHLDAGALFGVTEGAIMAVEPAAPAEGSAPSIGRVRITSATRLTAEATAEGDVFDVPPGMHARIEVPGADERLAVAVDSAAPEVAALVRATPSVRVAPSHEAEVWLTARRDGAHVLCDDAHGTGASGEPVLVVVPARESARIPAVLSHYARYRAPLRLARACTDLPGQLRIALLCCDHHVSSVDPQNPALPEVAGGAPAYPYRLRAGERFCVRVENRSPYRLYATLLNAASSGCVEYLGDAAIDGRGLHTFWRGGAFDDPFEASVTTGRPFGLDRFVVIGTTEPGPSLRFLEEPLRFHDVLASVAMKDAKARRAPPSSWTSQVTAVLIDARAEAAAGGSPGEARRALREG